MKKKEITISDIKKRNTAELIQLACQFNSEIIIENGQRHANAKSIMGVMAFCFTEGMSVNIIATGTDEQEALSAVENFLSHFNKGVNYYECINNT